MLRLARLRPGSMPGMAATLACLLLLGQGAWAQQRIAAVVNDEVVSVQDLNDRLDLVMFTSSIDDTVAGAPGADAAGPARPVEEALQLQEAERLGLRVEPQEIDQAIANIAERNNMDVPAMRRLLANAGVNFDTLRGAAARADRLGQGRQPAGPAAGQRDGRPARPRGPGGAPERAADRVPAVRDRAAGRQSGAGGARSRPMPHRLIQTVREGGSFESLARQVSAAASAEQGGDLGWVRGAMIPPDLLVALEQLEPGDVSAPLRSPVGYHVFWLRDRRLAAAQLAPSRRRRSRCRSRRSCFPSTRPRARRVRRGCARRRWPCARSWSTAMPSTGSPPSASCQAPGALGWLRIGELPPDFARGPDRPAARRGQRAAARAGRHPSARSSATAAARCSRRRSATRSPSASRGADRSPGAALSARSAQPGLRRHPALASGPVAADPTPSARASGQPGPTARRAWLPPLRTVIERFGLRADKRLGQHFLLDPNLCGGSWPRPGDLRGRTVLEIGPGPGGLTRALLASPARTDHRDRARPALPAGAAGARRGGWRAGCS